MIRRILFLLILLSAVLVANHAWAQGYGVYEHSACVAGRGGATVASPCGDGSSIYFNPAGIVLTPGQIVGGSLTVINPRGDFTNSTTGVVSPLNIKYFPVPAAFYKTNFASDKMSVGFGFFAPYGLTTDWPETSEGRYLGYKSVVQSLYMQPTFAYKVNEMFSVGFGVDVTRTSVELNQRLDLYPVPITGTPFTFGTLPIGAAPKGTDFANVQLKGHAWSAGINVGVIVKPTPKFSLGARYMSPQTVSISNGTVDYTQIPTNLSSPLLPKPFDQLLAPNFAAGGKLSDQGATTSLPLPDQFVAGVAIQATPKLLALVDYQFVHWAKFQSLVINQSIAGTTETIEQYRNTNGIRFGVDYALNPATNIRGGLLFHSGAAPDQTVTPLLPEGKRAEFSGGIGQKFGKARIDAYYMYLHQADRAGRTVGPPSGVPPTTALNNGTYSFMSHLFGVSLAYAF
ncbi:MAG: OmpP1/FadL family transporter [Bacteroidales bacterium]